MPDTPGKIFRKGLEKFADVDIAKVAEDPTSIFLAVVRYSQPEALAALALYCRQQSDGDTIADQGLQSPTETVFYLRWNALNNLPEVVMRT